MVREFWSKVKQDTDYRIKLFLFLSLAFNFAYALFLFIISRVYASKWFFIMSAYYALLSVARIMIYFQTTPKKRLKIKLLTMRICGYFLLLLNVVVSVMMFILIYTVPPVQHHEITVITLATYTFSAFTIAIVGSVKYVKKKERIYSCIKILSLLSASVSMVTLTNTMLATWGGEDTLLRSIILPILSGVVAIFIVACAVFMIKTANSDLRTLKNEEKRE